MKVYILQVTDLEEAGFDSVQVYANMATLFDQMVNDWGDCPVMSEEFVDSLDPRRDIPEGLESRCAKATTKFIEEFNRDSDGVQLQVSVHDVFGG